MYKLTTDFLIIMPLNIEQVESINSCYNEFALKENLPNLETQIDKQTLSFLNSNRIKIIENIKKNFYNYTWFTEWLILEKENLQPVGFFEYGNMANFFGEIEISFFIYPEKRKKGIMSDALKEMLRFTFLHPKIKTVLSKIYNDEIKEFLINNNFKNTSNKNGFEYLEFTQNEFLKTR